MGCGGLGRVTTEKFKLPNLLAELHIHDSYPHSPPQQNSNIPYNTPPPPFPRKLILEPHMALDTSENLKKIYKLKNKSKQVSTYSAYLENVTHVFG